MNPENPVVQLCAQGMQAEAEGRETDAHALFRRAWESAADDYEACVAAHYLARHQPTPEETLHWNQECLDRADRVADDRVKGFHASLHLNMAKAHQDLHHPDQARAHYERAAAHLDDLPPGPYVDAIRFAVADGLRTTATPAEGPLTDLISRWCARGDLRALALVLPPYLGDLGTDEDRTRLTTALHMVHAGRLLPRDEQRALGRVLASPAA